MVLLRRLGAFEHPTVVVEHLMDVYDTDSDIRITLVFDYID